MATTGSMPWGWVTTRGCGVAAAVLLVMLAGPGCGYRRPALNQPQGTLTLNGEPVAGASVMLVPLEPGRSVAGVSDQRGRLSFSTYGSNDGVPQGRYKAVVSKLVPTKQAARKLEAARARQAKAVEDAADEVMMELQDDDYENLLPSRYAAAATTDLVVTIDRRTRQITLALETESEADR